MDKMNLNNNENSPGVESLDNTTKIAHSIAEIFIDHYSNIIWVADQAMNVLYANRGFYDYFTTRDITGQSAAANQMPAQITNVIRETHFKVIETGKEIIQEMTIQNAAGNNSHFKVHMFPVNTKENLVGGYAVNIGVNHSHSPRFTAHQRYLQIIQSSSEAIWEWDITTGNTFKNNALLELIGFEKEETKGLSWWMQQIHAEDRKRINENIQESIRERRTSWNDFYRFLCKDGAYKHIRARAFVVYENKMPVRIIGTLRDVTELKELENQLVQERTNKQEEIAENVICALERERTMMGRELHDNINQLLAVSRLYINLLNPNQEEEKQIKKVLLDQLDEAINEIRHISGQLIVPNLKKKGLVANIKNLIGKINESKTIHISFTHDKKNYQISQGKKQTLYRIIQEQCNNIIKHSKASEAHISLSIVQNFIQLLISDNGIGFQADGENKGLGLSNIRERTLFYDGVIDIKSEEGKGCKVTVLIPI
jgi:PAS domain S-box-containing protein